MSYQSLMNIVWINEKSENIFKYIKASKTGRPHSSYKNRVDFNNETFSLTLKNMQKTDSGVYEARANGELTTTVAKHRVSVMDAVEAPVLSVNICNFTCKGHSSTISSIYNSSCFQEEARSSGNYNLSLYCSGNFIICNHSNPISWKNDTKGVNESCTINKEAVSPPDGVSLCLLRTVLCSVSLLLMISAVITVHIREKLRRSSKHTVISVDIYK
ncbi:uncharacterized protein LOC127442085 [Myxocyprinus asiaticus]|uniref:uncharacterized protein LOC127442085 n=1 Tax=Myxocyprinus asiaticus TaxID=70543 RepID=UPI0022219272|nr:uncharacterized protein LOC127442085 [Myxocyprinus asiaticus]